MESESTAIITRGSTSPSQHQPAASHGRGSTSSTCVSCRNKHLKCDGSQPCSRCSVQGTKCVCLQSQRGYRGPSRVGKNPGSVDRKSAPKSTLNQDTHEGSPNDAEIRGQNSTDLDWSNVAFGQASPQETMSSSVHFQSSEQELGPSRPGFSFLGGL